MNTDNQMKYDVQSCLKDNMPGLIELLGTQNMNWTRINTNLANNVHEIRSKLNSTQNIIKREATFYSIIINKLYGQGQADGMFDWFRTIFESLSLNLNANEKKLVRTSIYNVLVQLNKGYLNFMGELATLNEIKKIGKYELNNIEEQIQPESKKSADFLFSNREEKTHILVEVVNIHLYLTVVEGNKNIKRFIEGKLKDKLKSKFINPKYNFYLQPVLWIYSEREYELLVELYYTTGLEIDHVLPPFTYITYKNIIGEYEHHFKRMYECMGEFSEQRQ